LQRAFNFDAIVSSFRRVLAKTPRRVTSLTVQTFRLSGEITAY